MEKVVKVVSGYKYSSKDIVRKIDFVITESTTYNHKVIKKLKKNSYENYFFFLLILYPSHIFY